MIRHYVARRAEVTRVHHIMPLTGRAVRLPALRHRDLLVSAQSGDRELHARCGAELGFCDAAVDETDGAVKSERVRIGGHLQPLCAPCSQDVCDAVDQCSGNPAPPISRVHE